MARRVVAVALPARESPTMVRFRDTREVIEDVLDEIRVRCSRCGGHAVVRTREVTDAAERPGGTLFRPRRLVCPDCAYVADWSAWGASRYPYPYDTDPFFHAELWLQTPCAGHTPWAYNARHLDVLERFARGSLRETGSRSHGG